MSSPFILLLSRHSFSKIGNKTFNLHEDDCTDSHHPILKMPIDDDVDDDDVSSWCQGGIDNIANFYAWWENAKVDIRLPRPFLCTFC